jgi:radical SAM superfamily enzyme YgiQ (UPF0313 family)
MPKIGLNNPPMAPALLQAISKDMGCTQVNFCDINLLFQKWFSTDYKILNDWCELREPLNAAIENKLIEFSLSLPLSDIFDAEVLGISVFSQHSVMFSEWFLKTYRSKIKGIIVVGGAGVSVNNFGKELYDQSLIDFFVINEGERAWKSILAGTLPHLGVNSSGDSLPDFSDVPVPDYSGYMLNEYLNSQAMGTTVGVEGSRGCVRNCTFCDIKSFWKKYKFKDGVRLANELIELTQRYEVEHFFFNDSLVNGSDRAFRDFIATLSKYNLNNDKKIKWSGYYIIKGGNIYDDDDWINLKNSGVQSLYIGIESGSERVRDHMKKKFSDADIDAVMEKIQFYGIKCTWLLIVGYPTETEEDFNLTLDLLRKYQPMALDRTIDTVALGMTMGILPGSPLEGLREELNIHAVITDASANGINWENENSNFHTRVLRRIRAEETIRELGYNSWVGDNDVISYFENKIKELEENKLVNDDIAEYHG